MKKNGCVYLYVLGKKCRKSLVQSILQFYTSFVLFLRRFKAILRGVCKSRALKKILIPPRPPVTKNINAHLEAKSLVEIKSLSLSLLKIVKKNEQFWGYPLFCLSSTQSSHPQF